MYTFEALPVINTVNNHTGFIVVSIIAAFIALQIWLSEDEFIGAMVVFIVPAAIAAAVSFNTGEIITPVNEKVIGHFEGFVAEGYGENRTNGKTTYRAEVHNTYVVYSVNEERILFKASAGLSYPKTAILYKN